MPHLNPLITPSTEMGHREPMTINAIVSIIIQNAYKGALHFLYPMPMVLHAPTDVCVKMIDKTILLLILYCIIETILINSYLEFFLLLTFKKTAILGFVT